MYLIRRVYDVKPREARRAASLLAAIGSKYHEAGQRGPVRVSFNGGTLPGQSNIAIMEWETELIESPYRADNPAVDGLAALGAELREIVTGSRIEFYELLTPEKALEVG
jgi:hypothetical protein